MKKLTGFFLSAILGGFVAIGTYKWLDKTNPVTQNITEAISEKQKHDLHFANYNATPVELSINFTNAAEKGTDAVVHIKSAITKENYDYSYFDPFRDFFGYKPIPSEPAVASGSGVIISKDGFIVTNNHVVKNADKVEVILNNQKSYFAQVIGTDLSTDLALLKIDAQDLTYIPYGNSDDIKVGEWVLAIGNPFNLTSTVTAGIISAKGRNINILDGDRSSGVSPIESFIQTDAAVNPGNSGGALVNTSGELIGINTAIKSNTGSYTGYSFAIPVNIVKKVVDDLLIYGSVQRAFMGISIRNIDGDLAAEKKLNDLSGVYVSGVFDNGSAKDAGIQPGDVITKIGNVSIKNVPELQEQLSKFRPGDKIIASIKRDGKEMEFPVTLKNKFGNTEIIKKEAPVAIDKLGAIFENVNDEEKKKLGITSGVKVTKLNGGKIRSSGIQEGFVITRIDKKNINNVEELNNILSSKKGGVLIEGVYPNGMKAYYGFGL